MSQACDVQGWEKFLSIHLLLWCNKRQHHYKRSKFSTCCWIVLISQGFISAKSKRNGLSLNLQSGSPQSVWQYGVDLILTFRPQWKDYLDPRYFLDPILHFQISEANEDCFKEQNILCETLERWVFNFPKWNDACNSSFTNTKESCLTLQSSRLSRNKKGKSNLRNDA